MESGKSERLGKDPVGVHPGWIPLEDINMDGIISLSDFVFIAKYYGKDESDPEWLTKKMYLADFDVDGKIGLTDLAYFASVYGCADEPPPRKIALTEALKAVNVMTTQAIQGAVATGAFLILTQFAKAIMSIRK